MSTALIFVLWGICFLFWYIQRIYRGLKFQVSYFLRDRSKSIENAFTSLCILIIPSSVSIAFVHGHVAHWVVIESNKKRISRKERFSVPSLCHFFLSIPTTHLHACNVFPGIKSRSSRRNKSCSFHIFKISSHLSRFQNWFWGPKLEIADPDDTVALRDRKPVHWGGQEFN